MKLPKIHLEYLAILFIVVFASTWIYLFFKAHKTHSSVNVPTIEGQEDSHYALVNKYLALDGGIVHCSITGWQTQMLYFKQDLPVLASECIITPFETIP